MAVLTPLKYGALAIAGALLAAASAPAGADQALTAEFPSSTVIVDGQRVVTGTTRPGSTILLEQRVSGSWTAVGSDVADDAGAYAIRVPTWWLGSRGYRVRTGNVQSDEWQLKVKPAYAPSGRLSQFKFQSKEMARWNPCQAIHWRANLRQATKGALRDTKKAFRLITDATGIRFVYEGTTKGIPQWNANSWYPKDTQVVIAWARKGQSSLFDASPSADAVGAAYYVDGYRNGDGTPTKLINKGMVVIDSQAKFRGGFRRGITRGDVLLHELGHVMGLSHVSAESQMMNAVFTPGRARYGKGDLNAFERRGAELGCVYPEG